MTALCSTPLLLGTLYSCAITPGPDILDVRSFEKKACTAITRDHVTIREEPVPHCTTITTSTARVLMLVVKCPQARFSSDRQSRQCYTYKFFLMLQ